MKLINSKIIGLIFLLFATITFCDEIPEIKNLEDLELRLNKVSLIISPSNSCQSGEIRVGEKCKPESDF